jgi:isopenicillin N synthase-like dioxygenase
MIVDKREGFMWRYSPENDPDTKDQASIPPDVNASLMSEDFMWESTSHLPGFKECSMAYWQQSLTLSRKLVQIIALSLDLPESYFDKYVTYPGADGSYNYYPALTAEEAMRKQDISLGCHTDIQVFTLLWQDSNGGLQVLKPNGEWIKVTPIPDTLIVNIGDFLMRLSNDRYKSTVHRVSDTGGKERYSLSFFFGFNFNEKIEVVETCVPKGEKPKYEPISAGEVGLCTLLGLL